MNIANKANKWLVLHMQIRCSSLSITTTLSLLGKEFNVQSVLHVQVGLAADNHIYVFHEVMNVCKNPKIY